jgi:chemotaxis protein CheX
LEADDLVQLVQGIWGTLFGAELEPCAVEPISSADGFIMGCIQIGRAWEGVVVLRGSLLVARELASLMLGLEALEDVEICDALGELTNLMAGAAQTLLPAPSDLTPPSIIEGTDYKLVLPHSSMVNEAHFKFHGEPLSIMIFEADAQPTASQTSLERGNATN